MKKKIFSICLSVVVLVSLIAVLVPGCTGGGDTYELTMAANPAAGGTATDETGGSPYEEGADVDIKAVPADCYRFVNWSAPAGTFGNSTAAETTFTMPARDVTVTANFEAITLGHFKFYDVDDTSTPQFGDNQELTVTGPSWLAVPTTKAGHEEPVCLDHFLVYDVVPQTYEPVEVELNDQFTQETVTVYEPYFFANPVKKTVGSEVTKIQNPDDHLVFYWIEGESYETSVQFDNQFGDEQTLALTDPVLMAVPSEKLSWWRALDHFTCYATAGVPLEGEVRLVDQWVDITTTVLDPVFFCNPAEKIYDEEMTEICYPDDHLTVYNLAYLDYGYWEVTVDNQFGTSQWLTVKGPVKLAVPTQKLYPNEHGWPEGLDHYLLYEVTAYEFCGASVWLWDQFIMMTLPGEPVPVDVGPPHYFAIPVQKTPGSGIPTEIENPEAHLLFYDVFPPIEPWEDPVVINNQFVIEELLYTGELQLLAVPSQKISSQPVE